MAKRLAEMLGWRKDTFHTQQTLFILSSWLPSAGLLAGSLTVSPEAAAFGGHMQILLLSASVSLLLTLWGMSLLDRTTTHRKHRVTLLFAIVLASIPCLVLAIFLIWGYIVDWR